jgi:hypothetical protein
MMWLDSSHSIRSVWQSRGPLNHRQHQLHNIGVFLEQFWYNIVFVYVYELV